MILEIDKQYVGLPWKDGGRSREEGLDCVGLAELWLREQLAFSPHMPPSDSSDPSDPSDRSCEKYLDGIPLQPEALARGDILFLRERETGRIRHVAIHLGAQHYLHIMRGLTARIENGLTLMRRLGMDPAGALSPSEAERLCLALRDPALGWPQIIQLVIAIVLAVVAAALAPKLPRQGAKYGKYSLDGLATQASPELPLPDVLGTVVIAGNAPYTQRQDKSATITDLTLTKVNKLVIFNSAPTEEFDFLTGLKVNDIAYTDKFFHNGANLSGIYANPAQTIAEASDGTIGGDTGVPSFTSYDGAYDITVPVDVRAQSDRDFPIYGFSGCSYLVFRLIDSNKFQNFNVTCRIKGRKCRTFDSSGFTVSTATSESLTGADGTKVRFKLAFEDIISISSLTVNATSYSPISAAAQTGNIYQLNRTKGYVEFLTAPANAATITITYTYYPRAWTQNPASQVIYLLTENGRGKGFDATKIDFPAAVTLRDYCDAIISWTDALGEHTGPRFLCNYAIDFRKPIQEHLRTILDSCYADLFLSNGKYVLSPRTTGSSIFSFDTTNIIAGSFSSTQLDRSDRPNRLHAFYHSEDTLNAETEIIVDDEPDQSTRSSRAGNNGIVEQNLKYPAVTSQDQAARLATTTLRESVNVRAACELTTNIQGLALQPNDIVDITHPSRANWAAKLFRIDEISHTPQDNLALKLTEYIPSAYI